MDFTVYATLANVSRRLCGDEIARQTVMKVAYFNTTFNFQGKGKKMTYWLKGRDGFDKPLPDLSLQAGMDEHTFK